MSSYVPYSEVYNDRSYPSQPIQPEREGRRHDYTEDLEETARQQQLDAFNRPGARKADLNDRNLDYHHRNSRNGYMRERSADDAYYSRRHPRRYDDEYPDDYSEDEDYEQDDRRRRRSYRDDNRNSGRRAQSEKRPEQKQRYDGDMKGLVEKNFDLSPDGAMYTALGAGVGAIAARRFLGNHFDPKTGSQNWKTIGGAIVGGVAANAAEKQWQKRKSKSAGGYAKDQEGYGKDQGGYGKDQREYAWDQGRYERSGREQGGYDRY